MSANPRVSLFSSTNYTYDNIGRLTQAGADSFTYDKAGNNLNDNAVYNLLNNQMQENALYTLTYDAMGNLKTKYNKLTKETNTYTFNSRNQLITFTQTDENNQTVKTLSFTYDAFGRRVSKTEDGTTQKYLYDGDDIIAILDEQNQVIATITHDESIDTPLSITNSNGTFYYHRDHQGSIVALTDSTGAVVESFTYDNHYGTITNHAKTIETNNPYGYTGREFDTKELYFYRARYYDPQIQRFLGEDPIGFSSGDFNWYRYTNNNPIVYNDPFGYKISGVWNGSPRSYYGLNLNFSLATPNYDSEWWEITFIRVKATVTGMIVASVLCQDIDECGETREWVVNSKLEYSISMEKEIGVNPLVFGLGKLPIPQAKLLAGVLTGGIMGAKVALLSYKVNKAWNDWAEATINALLKYGPTAICMGTK